MTRRRSKPPKVKPSGRPETLAIRTGRARDIPAVLRMIRGLAEYEKLAHEVRATQAQLKKSGFGRKRYFHVLIAEKDKLAVGFALYFFTYSTFLARPTLYLEDLFVVPGERGTGTGKALLRALAKIAVKEGCERMDWMVLADNTPAIRFYKRLGANLHPNWVPTRLAGEPLRTLAKGRQRPAIG